MIGRVVLVSLLALSACKKKDSNAVEDPPTTKPAAGSSTTDSSKPNTPTTPSGDKRVNDSNWSPQTGPGFTISAPGPATIEKVPPGEDNKRPLERYTFHKTDLVSYVVEITEIPEADDEEMAINNRRMRITTGTQMVRHEDYIEGEITGRDLWYVVDQGDDTLRARSKLVGKAHKVYEIRGICPEGDAPEAEVDRFVASFAFTP